MAQLNTRYTIWHMCHVAHAQATPRSKRPHSEPAAPRVANLSGEIPHALAASRVASRREGSSSSPPGRWLGCHSCASGLLARLPAAGLQPLLPAAPLPSLLLLRGAAGEQVRATSPTRGLAPPARSASQADPLARQVCQLSLQPFWSGEPFGMWWARRLQQVNRRPVPLSTPPEKSTPAGRAIVRRGEARGEACSTGGGGQSWGLRVVHLSRELVQLSRQFPHAHRGSSGQFDGSVQQAGKPRIQPPGPPYRGGRCSWWGCSFHPETPACSDRRCGSQPASGTPACCCCCWWRPRRFLQAWGGCAAQGPKQ